MKLGSFSRRDTYCAFCKTPRRVYRKKSLSVLDFLLISALCLVIMVLITHDFDPRVIIFLVMALVVSEIVIHFRWRLSLVCRHCAFDPLLYLRNPDKAAEKVKFHLNERQEKPEAVFGPALNLPKKRVSHGEVASESSENKGKNISRQV